MVSSRGMTSIEESGVAVAAGKAPASGVGRSAYELTYNIEETHKANMHDIIIGNDLNFLSEPNLITKPE